MTRPYDAVTQIRCYEGQKDEWVRAAGGEQSLSDWIRATLDLQARRQKSPGETQAVGPAVVVDETVPPGVVELRDGEETVQIMVDVTPPQPPQSPGPNFRFDGEKWVDDPDLAGPFARENEPVLSDTARAVRLYGPEEQALLAERVKATDAYLAEISTVDATNEELGIVSFTPHDDLPPDPEEPQVVPPPPVVPPVIQPPAVPPAPVEPPSPECVNAYLHWKLAKGEACRFCGGTA